MVAFTKKKSGSEELMSNQETISTRLADKSLDPRIDRLTIKPESGNVIVFPSTYTYRHESAPPLSGTKYVVLAFTDFEERE
jgi:hypothetical protein